MKTKSFGKIYENEATLYYIENEKFKVAISDFGLVINEYVVKTKSGNVDIVLGFDDALSFSNSNIYAGAFIGRVANGIKDACFYLDGKKYELFANEQGNICNHGGKRGFDRQFYSVVSYSDSQICFSRLSVDGEENFPSNLSVKVTYTLTNNGLSIKIVGTADGNTYFAPTVHPYFNLEGSANGVEKTIVKINATNYLVKGESGLPEGEIQSVKNTPYDFTEFKEIGTFSYDNTYCGCEEYLATAINKKSGLKLDVYSNLKGLQLYVPNYSEEESVYGKGETKYTKRCAFCLEPEFYPNAVNVNSFEKPLLKKGETANYYINYFITEV